MIHETAGRLRSTRTADEVEEMLRKEMGQLTEEERAALEVLHRVLMARGQLTDEETRRFARIEAIFTGAEASPGSRAAA